jgi:hypothetical protein
MLLYRSLRGAALTMGLLAWVTGALAFPVQAQEETRKASDTAILIVGDDANPEMLRREKALIGEMARMLKKQQRIPIYSYHFNKARERSYCEKKLNILSEDLLFVGVVSLADRVPKKVLYRIDRIVTPARAAADVLNRSDEMIGVAEGANVQAVTPPPETAPVKTPAPSEPAETPKPPSREVRHVGLRLATTGRWRVQLGVFSQMKNAQEVLDQLKSKGYEGKVDKLAGEDKALMFKVFVGPFAAKEDAVQGAADLRAGGFAQSFVVETK